MAEQDLYFTGGTVILDHGYGGGARFLAGPLGTLRCCSKAKPRFCPTLHCPPLHDKRLGQNRVGGREGAHILLDKTILEVNLAMGMCRDIPFVGHYNDSIATGMQAIQQNHDFSAGR